ncbi:MAG: hypothetical protein QXK88_00885 [Desulfurococcaceae archaeon]
MQRRALVIAIYDPKWFLKVLGVLRRRDLLFQHYYTSDKVPYSSVVYTDFNLVLKELSGRGDLLVVYDPDKSCRKVEEAILASHMIGGYANIVMGIDPGSVLSYVFLGDDQLIFYGEGGLRELEDDLSYVLSCIPFEKVKIKIGAGPKSINIIEFLKKKFNLSSIELVDEAETSPRKRRIEEAIYSSRRLKGLKPFRHRDIYAAYKIALSKGVEVV